MTENSPQIIESDIKDVTFGSRVKIVKPVNLYNCIIGDDCFVGPFVEIQKKCNYRERDTNPIP